MPLISVSSRVEPSYHLLFLCCEKSGKQLAVIFFFNLMNQGAQGRRYALGYSCRSRRRQPSFTGRCRGAKPVMRSLESFCLNFHKAQREEWVQLAAFICKSGSPLHVGDFHICWEERNGSYRMQRSEITSMGSCWRDYKKELFSFNDWSNTFSFHCRCLGLNTEWVLLPPQPHLIEVVPYQMASERGRVNKRQLVQLGKHHRVVLCESDWVTRKANAGCLFTLSSQEIPSTYLPPSKEAIWAPTDTSPHSELGTSSEQLLWFCQKEVEIEINVSILGWKKVRFYTMSLLKNRIP